MGPKTNLMLIIDDNVEFRTMVSDYFTDLGFTVEIAGDGREGLLKARTIHPDIILCDVIMPDIGGIEVLRNLQTIFDAGRLGKTGYLSILPVDQGIEHSAAASFAPNPMYFDPKNICELAYKAGCNAVASTLGVSVRCRADMSTRSPSS